MSLHVPAGACIPVASASPIHVPLVQRVLKHCGAHKHIYIYIYIYTHVIQNNLRTAQLAGFARQLGCKNSSTSFLGHSSGFLVRNGVGLHPLSKIISNHKHIKITLSGFR